MGRRGIGGPTWGGGASRRRLFACALALLFGLLTPTVPASALNGQWDYWGRTRPLPFYVRVWSSDDGVCRRIVKALNGAGPWPASLYGDPIFLRWQVHPAYPKAAWDEPDKMFGAWMEVPFFNDGKPAIAFKLVAPGSRFIEELLFVFDDLEYFHALKRVPLLALLNDPRVLQPLMPFMIKSFDNFIALPKTISGYERWSSMILDDDVEINIAELNGKVYSVIREPSSEAILVLLFSEDSKGHVACIIGTKKPPR